MNIISLWSFVILLLYFCKHANSQLLLTNMTTVDLKYSPNANDSNNNNFINIHIPTIWNIDTPDGIEEMEGLVSLRIYKDDIINNNTTVTVSEQMTKSTPIETIKTPVMITKTPLVTTKTPIVTTNTPEIIKNTPKPINQTPWDIIKYKSTFLSDTADACRIKDGPASYVQMLIVITDVLYSDMESRTMIRKTWGAHNRTDVRIVFYLTREINFEPITPEINEEIRTYRDIVYIDESGYDPVYTAWTNLDWIKNKCNNAKFVLKIINGVCVNIPLLMNTLSEYKQTEVDTIWGRIRHKEINISKTLNQARLLNKVTRLQYCHYFGFLTKVKSLKELLLINVQKLNTYLNEVSYFTNKKMGFKVNEYLTASGAPYRSILKVNDKRFKSGHKRSSKSFFYSNPFS